jgi:threonine dehydrogenase-like Zn-dependent dehydrogenase
MRALVLDNGLHFHPNYADPIPREGEVLVHVVRAGICETDLQLMRGYLGFQGVLGHEFVGIAAGGRLAGRRVVGEINCNCGTCATCSRGLPTHCPRRTTIGISNHDGAFADLIAVPERNLHPVPDSVSDDVAVFAEPVAAAFQIPAQIPIRRTDRIIVLGDGRLGNLCAQVLADLADDVVVIGKHDAKLAVIEALGIRTARAGSESENDRQADIVVDCTGSESGLPAALALVRPRGIIVLKTTVAGQQVLPWAQFVIDEITLVGSRCGPFDTALAALASRRVLVEPLISTRFSLERGVDAIEHAGTPPVLKVLLDVAGKSAHPSRAELAFEPPRRTI